MIVLSIGMPRAGSGWFFNLTNDLLVANGFQDVRKIRERYHLQRVLSEVNCNIGAFTFPRLSAVLVPSILGNTFCVKAHAGPTDFSLSLVRRGRLVPTYIYRDPRDALLSAWEYGQRGINQNRPNAFSSLVDFESAIEFMLPYLQIWDQWMACPGLFHCKYEELLSGYDTQINQFTKFLKLNADNLRHKEVFNSHQPGSSRPGGKGLHFQRGKIGRFREVFNEDQIAVLNEKFSPHLERMGYEV